MIECVLLAVSGREQSEAAVLEAAELARGSDAEVSVFHVREFDCEALRGGPAYREAPEQAQALVRSVIGLLQDEGVTAWGEVSSAPYGRTPSEILAQAQLVAADVIVIGRRASTRLAALRLGGVAHEVTRRAECAVVVVPDRRRRDHLAEAAPPRSRELGKVA